MINRVLPQGTAESADLVAAIDEYVASTGYVRGTLAPMLARLGVRWVLLQNDLEWQRMGVPRPSTYDGLRADPGLRLAATFGRRGKNTAAHSIAMPGYSGALAAARGALRGGRGALAAAAGWSPAPPLLVAGAATPGPRWRPPGCWTGRRSPIPVPPRTMCCGDGGLAALRSS